MPDFKGSICSVPIIKFLFVILFAIMLKSGFCSAFYSVKQSSLSSILLLQSSDTSRLFSAVRQNTPPFLLNADEMKILLNHVNDLNVADNYLNTLFKFYVDDVNPLGLITPNFAKLLHNYPNVFQVNFEANKIQLNPALRGLTLEEKSQAIAQVNLQLKQQGVIKGWRNELLPISTHYHSKPLLLLERASVPMYGAKAYGVHINGFVRNATTQQISKLWVAKRSQTKSTWPGMLDHIVAGGQPHGVSLAENVAKECAEEASIPPALAKTAKPTGIVSYIGLDETKQYIKRDTLFCYDLELPETFQPVPNDSEVECFQLQELHWVLQRLLTTTTDDNNNSIISGQQFKPNCNLVIIDFFIRHGLIDPESPYFIDLCNQLRRLDRF